VRPLAYNGGMSMPFDPFSLLRSRRRIVGMSAVLLPFLGNGAVDWEGFDRLLADTLASGLIPAVNMDTGFANLLGAEDKSEVLRRTRSQAQGRPFLAGAFVRDEPGAAFDLNAYRLQIDAIVEHAGEPILFPSYGFAGLPEAAVVPAFADIAKYCPRFYAFELGRMFVPCGRIFTLDTFERLLGVPECVGLKHSSLERLPEWQRLEIVRRVRPDFQLLTGNDLAIDMVMYGSDYLLGLSAFAPEAFALRDRYWAEGDARFHELNDLLQYLGAFAFRAPTPGYRHSAAQFLKLRGKIAHDATHPQSVRRPDSDLPILALVAEKLARLIA
jgi:dihydrodipicolinate synthase/N-acetylneuraminate lyase